MLIKERPYLGFGLGLRTEHYAEIMKLGGDKSQLDWFEILTENYLTQSGKPIYHLDKIRALYPLVMHGVSLSVGSTDPIDFNYLKQVKELAKRIEPAWISDHLCWTGVNGLNMHDLLPLPYTMDAIQHVVERITEIQNYLGQQILVENVSSYLTYQQSEMTEWEFITEIANRADCFILLDVNNIYVSAMNHHFDPYLYLKHLPAHRVLQIHLAGHSDYGDYIIDTHDATIIKSVWDLYAATIQQFGAVSTMIERDDHIPSLNELLLELNEARTISAEVLKEMAS